MPDRPVNVGIIVLPETRTLAYAVEDAPPTGWTVSDISHSGSWDAVNKKVKWSFLDGTARTLTYKATPPAGESGTKIFSGSASFDGQSVAIGGDSEITPCTCHPADTNHDGRIVMDEVTAYAAAWKRGEHDNMDYVTNAAYIWKSGEWYHYVPGETPPQCWVPGQESASAVMPAGGTLGSMHALPSLLSASLASASSTAVRSLPPDYEPEVAVDVGIEVTPDAGTLAYAIEDAPPAGWTVSDISDGGSWDDVNKKVKWVFLDGTARTLTYKATPPAGESGTKTFSGAASFDGSSVAIGGDSEIPPYGKPGTATRSLPEYRLDGVPFTVSIEVSLPAGALAYAVEDAPPAVCTVSDISHSGSWDAVNKKVKWVFLDGSPRTLSYKITAACAVTGNFVGAVSFDGHSKPIDGDSAMPPCLHAEVRHPSTGDTVQRGQSVNIDLDTNAAGTFNYELWKGNTKIGPIPNPWTASGSLPPDNDYRIKAIWSVDSNLYDFGGYFTINGGDTEGPSTANVAAVPKKVREGKDLKITVTATIDDSAKGNSNIAAAECFVGADPGTGNGTPMLPIDGAFDSPTEVVSGTINTSSWHEGGSYRVNVRGKDCASADKNWGSVANILYAPGGEYEVVDETPPAPSRPTPVPVPALEILWEGYWYSAGSVLPEEEETVIDLGELESVGAVGLTVEFPPLCFPTDFSIAGSANGTDWELIASAMSFRPMRGGHIWQCEPAEYRYIRLTATSLRDRRDGHYYVRIPEVVVYESLVGNAAKATWTATADDDNLASSGPASVYDLRYSASPITEANWASATQVPNEPTPGPRGTRETCTFSVGDLASVYVGLKIGDEVPNWSDLRVIGPISAQRRGFVSIEPASPCVLDANEDAPMHRFVLDPEARPCFMSVSNDCGFPQRFTRNEDGEVLRTMRFPMRPGAESWQANTFQWRALKRLMLTDGALYWRLEGRCPDLGTVYGPWRQISFDCGQITDLHVVPSHDKGGDEAVWPVPEPPTFRWTDNTTGMERFYIDVSKDPSIPIADGRATITINRRGAANGFYTPNAFEWRRIMQLATHLATPLRPSPANGVLYWRVRAEDRFRALSCASSPKTLIVDGGEFSALSCDTDPATDTMRFNWTHNGDGIAGFKIEVSVDANFEPGPRYTLVIPFRAVDPESYTLRPGEERRLQFFARRNDITLLHWRVRGETARREFVCYSESSTCDVP